MFATHSWGYVIGAAVVAAVSLLAPVRAASAEPDPRVVVRDLGPEDGRARGAALTRLLRYAHVTDLPGWQRDTSRLSITHVLKAEAGGVTWRLVRCYGSDGPPGSHHTVAFLFDDEGRLRDWLPEVRENPLVLEDLNQDGNIELAAYDGSARQYFVYSYDRVRSRELLRLDDLGLQRDSFHISRGGSSPAASISVPGYGQYFWDPKAARYVRPFGPYHMLAIMKDKSDAVAHVKVLRKLETMMFEIGVFHGGVACQVIDPIKGKLSKDQVIAVGIGWTWCFPGEPLDEAARRAPMEIGEEHVVFLKGEGKPQYEATLGQVVASYAAIDWWVGRLPYDQRLVRDLKECLR